MGKIKKNRKNQEKQEKQDSRKTADRRRGMNIAYLCLTAGVFALTALALLALPKTTFSEAEKRELTKYPDLTVGNYFSGEYAETVSKWFADTVPARAELMNISAALQNVKGVKLTDKSGNKIELIGGMKPVNDGDDVPAVAVIKPERQESGTLPADIDIPKESAPQTSAPTVSQKAPEETIRPSDETEAAQSESSPAEDTSRESGTAATEPPVTEETAAETTAPISNGEIRDPGVEGGGADADVELYNSNGTAIVGDRAFLMYSRYPAMEDRYAAAINRFKAGLPDVNVYCMIVPTQCEFYSPPELDGYHSSQLKTINYIASQFVGVRNVDVYTPLAAHVNENIYLRTDHHWTSLGAYYAAEAFAEAAGVPFAALSNYEKRVNKGFCGTMYGYTNYNPAIKDNPEDFFYYVPKHVSYTTTYYNYKIEKVWNIIGVYEPFETQFFVDFGDNGSDNYCTFMCGDAKIVHVKTDTGNGRKLAIFKDSFGSAVPGFLFGSFEEIYVLDMRYFTHNGIDFMKEKGITDLLFCNNAFTTDNTGLVTDYETIVSQEDWGF